MGKKLKCKGTSAKRRNGERCVNAGVFCVNAGDYCLNAEEKVERGKGKEGKMESGKVEREKEKGGKVNQLEKWNGLFTNSDRFYELCQVLGLTCQSPTKEVLTESKRKIENDFNNKFCKLNSVRIRSFLI